jgi:antitoxin ParD1/3/4
MVTMNISLPQSLKAFVDDQVAAGRYRTASAYVQSLLRRAKEKGTIEAKLVEGIEALDRGEASEMTTMDWNRLRTEYRKRHEGLRRRKTS